MTKSIINTIGLPFIAILIFCSCENGSIFAILGLFMIIRNLTKGFNTSFPSGDWNAIIYLFEGFLIILFGIINMANKKYYIEWDDKELNILLPDTKKVETIKIGEINTVDIKLFEIHLNLKDRTKILYLNPLQFEDLKKSRELWVYDQMTR